MTKTMNKSNKEKYKYDVETWITTSWLYHRSRLFLWSNSELNKDQDETQLLSCQGAYNIGWKEFFEPFPRSTVLAKI